MPIASSLLAFSLFSAAVAAEPVSDACAPLLPKALISKLASELPAFQVPSSADLGEARTAQLASSGDWPCPLVVLADFDGNGTLDRALLVKARDGADKSARLIGALNLNGQWQISLSEEWPLELSSSELHPQESGLYQRADAISKPNEQFDQLASLQTENAAFSAGKVDGQYAVYAYITGKWQKLTMRD